MLLIFLCKFFMIIFGLGLIPFFLFHFVVAIKGGGRFKGKSKFFKLNFHRNNRLSFLRNTFDVVFFAHLSIYLNNFTSFCECSK